ncbi:ankyrin repeat domain-containing protein [Armatimonas sp.]|uniref:ankyrin repeat domain-containing protein n=1 Tax=Armatimonas sp. TaxID=1872638 RepID=UPI00374CE646
MAAPIAKDVLVADVAMSSPSAIVIEPFTWRIMVISIIMSVALIVSAQSVDIGSLHTIFAKGTDENCLKLVKQNPSFIQDKDSSQCTALHYAARYGRAKTAKWLIENKADVNTVAYNKFTPMHVVTDGSVAQLLIKSGANLKAKNSFGKTPLQMAAQMGRKKICEVILASGYPIDLSSALWLGKRDSVKAIIKENPAIVKEGDPGPDLWGNVSPLGIAAAQGDKEIVELLLKAGAPVNSATDRPNSGQTTALCNAVLAKHYDIAEILCNAGADCNVGGGKYDETLLDYALKNSEKKMIALLIKYGAKSPDKH